MITVDILCNSAADTFRAVSAIGNSVISVTNRKKPVNPKCTKARYRKNDASNVWCTRCMNNVVARYGYDAVRRKGLLKPLLPSLFVGEAAPFALLLLFLFLPVSPSSSSSYPLSNNAEDSFLLLKNEGRFSDEESSRAPAPHPSRSNLAGSRR